MQRGEQGGWQGARVLRARRTSTAGEARLKTLLLRLQVQRGGKEGGGRATRGELVQSLAGKLPGIYLQLRYRQMTSSSRPLP